MYMILDLHSISHIAEFMGLEFMKICLERKFIKDTGDILVCKWINGLII
jgi:hypothetical protein